MSFSYFIPVIHLGPVKSNKISIDLPIKDIEKLIIGSSSVFEVVRYIIGDGEVIYESKLFLEYKNKIWINKEAEKFEWTNHKDIFSYVETQVNQIEGKGLTSSFLPSFYVFYTNKYSKSYVSCGNWKYGNIRVVMQMAAFGKWVDGYPAINIDRESKITYSIAIVNPYLKSSKYTIEIKGLNIIHNVIVKPQSVEVIGLADIILKNKWTGQIYVYGKQRSIMYVINHDIDNLYDITTIEHSDPFRAELNYMPRFQYIRSRLHSFFKRLSL